jgi:hypothetical protein
MNVRPKSRRSSLALIVAGALVASLGSTLSGTAAATDRTATAHHAGQKTVATKTAAKARMFRLPHNAGEPTIGITRDGHVFYTAGAGCVTSCTGEPQMAETVTPGGRAVYMTPDKGKTWKNVSPGHPDSGVSPHVTSLDPYLYVDHNADTDRVFTMDLTALACSELSFSDDQGKTWITNPIACGEPVNDHQTLFSGKPTKSPSPLYGKVLYYCFNKVAYTRCTKSIDGGLTFVPTTGLTNPECSGLNGHGVTDKKGVIYLPYTGCASAPAVAISTDEADTWKIVKVPGVKAESGGDPSVAVDRDGNIYVLYVDNDRQAMLSTSKNGGKTWSKPVNVAAPGVVYTNLATLTVGAPGKVAIAYYGTTSEEKNGFWNGYLAAGVDVLGKNPTFYSSSINNPKNPLKAKGCGPGRCGRVLDFIDVEIAPDGAAWGAYVDACLATCEKTGAESYADNQAIAATMLGAPRLDK